ncbi:rod-binding protein [Treponema sp. OMZ 803]|uniref:rod-binding protein n=1 Tax=Treponema sp. OMZ 803 TaxID=120682 RepID=UPI0020A39862|nr:rod-binding protein [Treponema sp. OMZ 803]UTC53684.1 rod-binding protein [Treponema sp. OMZ 803]
MISAVQHNSHTAPQHPANKHAAKNTQSFSQLLDSLKTESARFSTAKESAHSNLSTRLPGEYLSSFEIVNPTDADRAVQPKGMGAAAAAQAGGKAVIDKTSELYQQALELESYFVKIMLDSMRSTLGKNSLTGKDSFAGKMYDDMMYEELSRTMTKNAGLGLADQIYLQLNGQA